VRSTRLPAHPFRLMRPAAPVQYLLSLGPVPKDPGQSKDTGARPFSVVSARCEDTIPQDRREVNSGHPTGCIPILGQLVLQCSQSPSSGTSRPGQDMPQTPPRTRASSGVQSRPQIEIHPIQSGSTASAPSKQSSTARMVWCRQISSSSTQSRAKITSTSSRADCPGYDGWWRCLMARIAAPSAPNRGRDRPPRRAAPPREGF
jgi:hypothetical protein